MQQTARNLPVAYCHRFRVPFVRFRLFVRTGVYDNICFASELLSTFKHNQHSSLLEEALTLRVLLGQWLLTIPAMA